MGDSGSPQQKVDAAHVARGSGIPEDRAKASVFCSVTPVPVEKPNPWHSTGTKTNGQEPVASIVVQPPTITKIGHRIQQYTPVKIGYLDRHRRRACCSVTVSTRSCSRARTRSNDGELKRPIEIMPMVARGLPREDAAHRVAGYEALCDAGCLAVLGPYITDNAMALLPAMERRQVPAVSTNGAKAVPQLLRLHARQRWRVRGGRDSARGGCARRASSGSLRSPRSRPAATSTRRRSAPRRKRNRVNLVADVFVDQTGDDLADALRHLHDDVQPDAIAYLGYGYPVAMFNPILRELDWDPPRIMSTAFMWYINEPSMLDDMEGWYGVDQVGNDERRLEPELLAVRRTASSSASVAG